MSKNNKSSTQKKTLPLENKSDSKNIKKSLAKTYGVIGVLILSYFFLTFSVNSVDKKMDKLSGGDTTITQKQTIDENLLFLSSNNDFIGITRCSNLPLNRLSIKDSISSHSGQTVLSYSFLGDNSNNLVIAGLTSNYTQVIFTDISDINGNKVQKEVFINIPKGDTFIVSSTYSTSYENIKLVSSDNTIIELK